MPEKPSILFISENYPPENFAAAIRVYERGVYWNKWGYGTQFITSFPNRHQGKSHRGYENSLYKMSFEDGIGVLRVKTYIPKSKHLFYRALHQISFMISAFIGGLLIKRKSIVIATTPQFFCSFSGLLIARIKRIPFILEIADIWTNSIKGTVKNNSFFFSLLLNIEEFIFRKADAIIVLTEGFREEIIHRGIQKEKLHVVRNGVNKTQLENIKPVILKEECDLDDELIVGYAGSLGPAQGLRNICDTAQILHSKKITNIKFIFIGEGDDKKLLEKQAEELDNIIYLGNKDREVIPAYLACFDIGLAHLSNSPVWKTTIPSKIFEMMASGLPIMLVSPQGEASGIIKEYDVGKWINAGDPKSLADSLIDLASDREKLKRYAKNSLLASKNFRRDIQAQKIIDVVEKVISSKINKDKGT